LDGKTLCNSRDGNERAIHLVSAFSAQNDLVLGQLATKAKSNEIKAFPLLIEMLDLRSATVTIDTAGCQKEIAKVITEKGGDYVLALKGNQEALYEEAKNFFTQALGVELEEAGCDYFSSEEKSRNRIEKREIWTASNLEWLPQLKDWEGLRSLACVRSTRVVKGKETMEWRYYISSLESNAERIGKAIRTDWLVENKLHWQLDVFYREDCCKVR